MKLKSFKTEISYCILSFIILCVTNPTVFSNPNYDNNSNIRLAHQNLYALRPFTVENILKAEELKNPDNAYIAYYRLYSEIITLIISNSAEEFRKREPVLDQYLKKLKELPDNTPDYRLLLGEAYVFTGLINVKYDNEISGFIDCIKGYKLLEDNAKKYPSFEPGYKMLGLIEIGVNFLPGVLQRGAKLFNIKSDPQEGLKRLNNFSEFAKGKPGYEEEALFFTLGAYRLMNREASAMKLINREMGNFKDIAILNFFAATVCVQANSVETAFTLLSKITPEKIEIDFPPLLFLKGKTKLMRLDQDADIALIGYLKLSSGSDYIKTVLYDLACFYYMSGNTKEYLAYIEKVKEEGREFLSRDLEAAYEARKPGFPNICMMRADFLIKGGYFLRAEEELFEIDNINTLKDSDKAYYHYLIGECYRLRNNVRQAESEYLNAVLIGKVSGNYIAQKALVNSGLMMEKNSLKNEAEKYYNSCLQFKASSNPYSDLYKNKARAGLIRISLSE
jgi:hypothetical protein